MQGCARAAPADPLILEVLINEIVQSLVIERSSITRIEQKQ